MEKQINILLVGLGNHSMRTYWNFLSMISQEQNLSVVAVVDMESRKAIIDDFISASNLKPQHVILTSPAEDDLPLDAATSLKLDRIHAAQTIHKIIIATEPRAHRMYMDWAAARGIDILVEKPVVAFTKVNENQWSAIKIRSYVHDFIAANPRSRVSIQAQRRYNAAYSFAYEYIKEFIALHKVPISFLTVYHCDGLWNSAEELAYRETHPYKYGYGKIMHSGYHYVDLFSWFSELNALASTNWADSLSMYTEIFTPQDLLHQLSPIASLPPLRHAIIAGIEPSLGEVDCYNSLQFTKGKYVVMTGKVDMLQNSVSDRNDFSKVHFDKKSMGAVKYEELNLYVGPLLKVKIYSKANDPDHPGRGYSFCVEITKNANLLGGKRSEIHTFTGDAYATKKDKIFLSLNQKARLDLFNAFLQGNEHISTLPQHQKTNDLISYMYENIIAGKNGRIPYVKIQL